ncbi:MAG: alpha-hydroxy-acid oxidizing protein [Solirubrobacteraceae bacterium]
MSEGPPRPSFAAHAAEIFLRGLVGERPSLPLAYDALARLAHERLLQDDPRAADYVLGGAGREDTIRANEGAFSRWRIVPRVLRDVTARDLRTTVLETELPAPVALAPVGVQTVVHPEGEAATARAAAAVGLPLAVSTVSSAILEDVAAASGAAKWFQLYMPADPELAASLVARAERAGYRAIMITVDTVLPGWRTRELQLGWQPFLHGVGIANYTSDPVFRARLARPPEEDPRAAVAEFSALFTNPGMTWGDIELVRSWTALPLAVKGIVHPDDAREARERGADGVVVSNHGGRQLDGAIATLDALPAIVDAVGDRLDVLLDGGVRSGTDVLKALALGARTVLLGRPWVWGLALGGEQGVAAVLRAVLGELDISLGLSGHTTPAQLHPGVLVRDAHA